MTFIHTLKILFYKHASSFEGLAQYNLTQSELDTKGFFNAFVNIKKQTRLKKYYFIPDSFYMSVQ